MSASHAKGPGSSALMDFNCLYTNLCAINILLGSEFVADPPFFRSCSLLHIFGLDVDIETAAHWWNSFRVHDVLHDVFGGVAGLRSSDEPPSNAEMFIRITRPKDT